MADKNYLSFANWIDFTEVVGDLTPDAPDYSDTLKLSNCSYATIHAGKIVGGREDCVDINRGQHLAVLAAEYHPRGKYVFTIKGGAENVHVEGKLMGHGSETDVDIGNWSDQSMSRTKAVYLNLTTHDGSPIKVRVLHGWNPILVNGCSQKYEVSDGAKGVFAFFAGLAKKLKLA